MAQSSKSRPNPELSGWLYKWTNYLRGYQKRWFVLSHGYLCYYRNQEEMEYTCRGTLSLRGATIYSEESNNFIVSNGETYHIKAPTDAEKSRWVEALISARAMSLDQDAPNKVIDTSVTALTTYLKSKLEEVRSCNELMNSHHEALGRSLSEFESATSHDIKSKTKEMSEKVEIVRASTAFMIKACSDYLDLAECHYEKWIALVHKDSPRGIQLNNVVKSGTDSGVMDGSRQEFTSDEDNFEFFDCEEAVLAVQNHNIEKTAVQVYPAMVGGGKDKKKGESAAATSAESKPLAADSSHGHPTSHTRRVRVPDRPKVSANLWSIIKNAVGKDLTKIPVPVNFSEPLSLLQRLTEDFEYAHQILDKASSSEDPGEQIAYVASFAVSSYSTTINRVGKPFNPLLGETYECDRTSDLGWKSIAEQVSHHPPIAALHCESKDWCCWQEQHMNTKFRGQYLQVIPLGEVHLKFKKGNVHYSWKKAVTNIRNIIIGKMWIDQEGDLDVKCHTTGYTCKLTFLTPGYFSGEPYKLVGVVIDKKGSKMFNITGGYDTKLELSVPKKDVKQAKGTQANETEQAKILWERVMPPADSDKYYNFTVFACQLNELEDGVAPTDSRFRPDQRLMEEGKFDQANDKKVELEELQRSSRRKRQETITTKSDDSHLDTWIPTWFQRDKDVDTKSEIFVFRGEYWHCKLKKDWSRCPKIYAPSETL
ncbi:hypothetical protein GE061_012713 [Apolygus lucorum]|uniref:Oxysterol-binding protein n=1 Tax=Apolygus lucorum TaxID=248454 RepID=A0A6A4K2C2_APOLU|nr:hypothetical protein GE061_012713 [Apolygus lucorum]